VVLCLTEKLTGCYKCGQNLAGFSKDKGFEGRVEVLWKKKAFVKSYGNYTRLLNVLKAIGLQAEDFSLTVPCHIYPDRPAGSPVKEVLYSHTEAIAQYPPDSWQGEIEPLVCNTDEAFKTDQSVCS
jgi:hypothetical protein